MNKHWALGGAALALSTIAAARLGGWAVVTVENPPDYLVAGRPTELTFSVRQHGNNLLPDLRPTIEARSGMRSVTGNAVSTSQTGVYRGSVTVPEAGTWQITIHSGFGRSKGTMLPLQAIEPTSPVPIVAEAERGRLLFAAKGCVTCHVHGGVDVVGELRNAAPDLTDRRFPAEYLAKFLANPAIKPPMADLRMPNLGLKQPEIAALVAFINSDRKLSSR